MNAFDDATLLTRWAEGDAEAGNALLGRYFDRLLMFFGPRAENEVEDLVQRTMLACARARDSVQRASSFRSFLFRTAHNALIDYYRTRRVLVPDSVLDDAACERTTPSQLAIGREHRRALAIALTRIDLELQVVVALHYWEGMTTGQLAETLEIPAGTVKSRLRRAKEALQREMSRLVADGDLHATLDSLSAWARRVRDEAADAAG